MTFSKPSRYVLLTFSEFPDVAYNRGNDLLIKILQSRYGLCVYYNMLT